jgi:hypothetical protein
LTGIPKWPALRMFNWIAHAWDATVGKIPSTVSRWVRDVVNGLWSFLFGIFGHVGHAWTDFELWAYHYTHEALGLADQMIRVITEASHWIVHEGARLWFYLTHPDKWVLLIWDPFWAYVEHESWDLAGKLGKFFFSLFYKNMREFITLIEDILDAVL